MKGLNKVFKGNEKGIGSKNKKLSPEIEKNLVEYIQKMEGMFYGLTTQNFRSLAFKVAEKNKLPNYFSNKKKALESLKAFWDGTNSQSVLQNQLQQPEKETLTRSMFTPSLIF